jgi:hypothetical protein
VRRHVYVLVSHHNAFGKKLGCGVYELRGLVEKQPAPRIRIKTSSVGRANIPFDGAIEAFRGIMW